MPYINITTNVKINDKQESMLRSDLGKLISLLPGKSERWLMTNIQGDAKMSFSGSTEACAIIEVSVYGAASAESYDRLTSALTDSLADVLNITKDRIYVKYSEHEFWGYAGSNF